MSSVLLVAKNRLQFCGVVRRWIFFFQIIVIKVIILFRRFVIECHAIFTRGTDSTTSSSSLGKWLQNETHASTFYDRTPRMTILVDFFCARHATAGFMIVIWHVFPSFFINWKCSWHCSGAWANKRSDWEIRQCFNTFPFFSCSQSTQSPKGSKLSGETHHHASWECQNWTP